MADISDGRRLSYDYTHSLLNPQAPRYPMQFSDLTPPYYPPGAASRLAGRVLCWPSDRALVAALALTPLEAGGCEKRGIGLLGLADDLGVRMNGGRPGAREGPAAFRAALSAYGVFDPVLTGGHVPPVVDFGDIVPAGDLDETHRRVQAAARALDAAGWLPVGMGGGHDLTLPWVMGIIESRGEPLRGIYLDAHLDVREQPGSGMAFRRLLEEGTVPSVTCLGCDLLANSDEHLKWFQQHGGTLAELADRAWPVTSDGHYFVSLDLDVMDAAHAPGVSAMNPAGFCPRQVAWYAERAGRDTRVVCFDIMELSPPHDDRQRTARLAAHLFLRFLAGCAARAGEGRG